MRNLFPSIGFYQWVTLSLAITWATGVQSQETHFTARPVGTSSSRIARLPEIAHQPIPQPAPTTWDGLLLPSEKQNPQPSLPAETWWRSSVGTPLLGSDRWVSFDLPTILVDALRSSPYIQGVKQSTSIQLERIVQQDSEFDARYLVDGGYGLTNDPVGNSLVTGGPPRLREESYKLSAGLRKNTRSGATLDLSQELGFLDSNSTFISPAYQGNSRLSLSLTQPLLAGRGKVYNERLITSAKINSRVSWQQLRQDVESRLADVMIEYWHLYEDRCHLLQQSDLINRGEEINKIIQGRTGFDVGRIELAKIRQRIDRRRDASIQMTGDVKQKQARLRMLIGSPTLSQGAPEMIPIPPAEFPRFEILLQDAVRQGIDHRPSIKAAMEELQAAAVDIQVSRHELLPRLNGIVKTYLAGLNGRRQVFKSFADQFHQPGPGISASLEYELPRGNRSARSKHRAAMHHYQQRSSELEQAIQDMRMEIEFILIQMNTSDTLRQTKKQTLKDAVEEESILTNRYNLLAGDGSQVGTVLESLLDAQQRRTDAEFSLVSAQVEYHISLIQLQQAMGTLLLNEGIRPIRQRGSSDIEFRSPAHQTNISTLRPTITAQQQPLFDQEPSDLINLHESYSSMHPLIAEPKLIEMDQPMIHSDSEVAPRASTEFESFMKQQSTERLFGAH